MHSTRFLLAPLLIAASPGTLAAPVPVPGTSLHLNVPAGFVLMPRSVVLSKYARGTPPTTVYSTPGPAWDVNLAFALRDTALPAGSLAPVQAGLERSLEGAPGFRWVRHGLVKSGGREWIDLQFWVDGVDTPIYNHLRLTREGQQTLVVTANVTKAQYPKYAPLLDQAISDLK